VPAARVEGAPELEVPGFSDEVRVRRALRDFLAVLTQGLRPELFPEGLIVSRHGREGASSRGALEVDPHPMRGFSSSA
jgi:hypothetical protein